MSQTVEKELAVNVPEVKDRKRWLALGFISLSLFIISIDDTVLNVALPSISRDLGSSASELQWMIDAYILTFAALLLTMGAIGDRIGRKKMLQWGLVLFGMCSVLAALSNSSTMLITARALLGIGGAMMMPSTLSILTATFRDDRERAQAIAIWAAVFALGFGVGPLMAGLLLEHYSWSSVFLVNIPIVAVAIIGGYLFIEDSRDAEATSPDMPGALLSIAALFSLVYGIIKAGEGSWTEKNVLLALCGGFVLLIIFAWWERRAKHPMLPLNFFRNMSFTGANTTMILVTFALFSVIFFLSQYFQSVQGYTALQTGVRLLPMALVLTLFAALSARIAMIIGTKLSVSIGCMVAACGFLILSRIAEPDTGYWGIMGIMFIGSAGVGIVMSPATNSIMGSVPASRAGIGSAMNDSTRLVGGALGIAVLGTIMNSVYRQDIDELMSPQAVFSPEAFDVAQSSIQGAHIIADTIPDPVLSQRVADVANHAFVSGMNDAFMVAAIVMAAAAVIALIILPSKIRPWDEASQ